MRVMISANLPGTTTGLAIWGGLPGRAHLTIDSGLRNTNNSPFGLYKTVRHELGHVLGLHHEHQWWDRDEHITVPSKDANLIDLLDGVFNYTPLKEYFSIPFPLLKIKMVSVRIGWFTVWLPVPYIEWIELDLFRLADSYGDFDYNSIMLYSGTGFNFNKNVNVLKYTWKNDIINSSVVASLTPYIKGDRIPHNAKISANDARTVKKIYEKDFWFW